MRKGDQRSEAPGLPARRLAGLRAAKFSFDEFDQTTGGRPSRPSSSGTPQVPVVSHAIQKHLDDLRDAAQFVKQFSLSKEIVRELKRRAIYHRFRPEVARRIMEQL